jgi:hypothetical protein
MADSIQIKEVSNRHEAVMDVMLCNPFISLSELSTATKYSYIWLSILTNSNAFKARLAERRKQLDLQINTDIVNDLDANLRGAAVEGLKKVNELLQKTEDLEGASTATEKLLGALGYSPKNGPSMVVNNNVQNNGVIAGNVSPNVLAAARASFGNPNASNLLQAPDGQSRDSVIVDAVVIGTAELCETKTSEEKCEGEWDRL